MPTSSHTSSQLLDSRQFAFLASKHEPVSERDLIWESAVSGSTSQIGLVEVSFSLRPEDLQVLQKMDHLSEDKWLSRPAGFVPRSAFSISLEALDLLKKEMVRTNLDIS